MKVKSSRRNCSPDYPYLFFLLVRAFSLMDGWISITINLELIGWWKEREDPKEDVGYYANRSVQSVLLVDKHTPSVQG